MGRAGTRSLQPIRLAALVFFLSRGQAPARWEKRCNSWARHGLFWGEHDKDWAMTSDESQKWPIKKKRDANISRGKERKRQLHTHTHTQQVFLFHRSYSLGWPCTGEGQGRSSSSSSGEKPCGHSTTCLSLSLFCLPRFAQSTRPSVSPDPSGGPWGTRKEVPRPAGRFQGGGDWPMATHERGQGHSTLIAPHRLLLVGQRRINSTGKIRAKRETKKRRGEKSVRPRWTTGLD